MTTAYPNEASEKKARLHVLLFITGITLFISAAWFLVSGKVGLNLWDEGYLWHDVQRTYEGSVPIRDFRAYEPGRYYWGALFFHMSGPGLFSLRLSMHVFMAIGLFFGLLSLRRVIRSKAGLIAASLFLCLWMYPRYKAFEHTLILTALFLAVRLLENPSLLRHYIAGCLIGLSAWFGKNLGIYFLTGFVCLIVYDAVFELHMRLFNKFLFLVLGLITGYMPMLVMVVFVHGFQAAHFDSIIRIFGPFAPVKSLPTPWPWKLLYTVSLDRAIFYQYLFGCTLTGILLFYAASACVIVFSKRRFHIRSTLWIASVFIGVPLIHHMTGRADFFHLAESIMPFLAGILAAIRSLPARTRFKIPVLLVILAVLTILPLHYSSECLMIRRHIGTLIGTEESVTASMLPGGRFWLDTKQADYIDKIRAFRDTHVDSGRTMLIVPYEAGLYPVLKQNAPIWDPFPIHRATPEEEERSIQDLETNRTQWVILFDWPLDRMPERHFSHTHPLLWEHLMKHYKPAVLPDLPEGRIFMKLRSD
ncbi:hypothetical protein JW948_07850 [bacterium]|nr:hypothetical protein [bacterium]